MESWCSLECFWLIKYHLMPFYKLEVQNCSYMSQSVSNKSWFYLACDTVTAEVYVMQQVMTSMVYDISWNRIKPLKAKLMWQGENWKLY